MINTKDFRTKTYLMEKDNGKLDNVWEIALDIGYSSVKIMSPNIVASFPSYAKRIDDSFQYVGDAPKESILYKDLASGDMWVVGEVAQNLIASGDTSDSESSLYGRDRYANEIFRVIANTGLGLGYLSNKIASPSPSDIITVQTGLPDRYMNDEDELKEALAGKYGFLLKIGDGEWQKFSFEISLNNIFVMSQPRGALFSVCIGKDRQFVPDAKKYLSSSVLIVDPGFGTLDVFPIISTNNDTSSSSGVVAVGETYSDLGMKRILQETAKLIKENYNITVYIPAMQKNLETGTVRFVDKKKFISKDYNFDKYLAQASSKVCDEAINRIITSFNLGDFNYFILTGGTGAAWYEQIKDKFKQMSTLKIIKGNQNDDLDFIFSNVRGYYLFRYNKLWKETIKK